MSSLPEEIQVEILLRLPVKSLLTFKCVCKPWLYLISSQKFINDHLSLSIQKKNNQKIMFTDKESVTGKPLMYSIDYASVTSSPDLSCEYIGEKAVLMEYYPFEYKNGMEVRILGACNGLICFGILIGENTSICIWNPTTREYKETQHSDFHMNPSKTSRAGFGYDSKTGDYKMVRITDYKKSDYCEFEVYTFGSHLSKTVHTFPYKYPCHVAFGGVFLNGALHWTSNVWMQDNPENIVSFDISNEKLMDFPLPEKSIIDPEDSSMRLFKKVAILGDCLSLVLVNTNLFRAEVWVMQDYGVRESWNKLFTTAQIPIISYPFTPVMSLKNGEVLLYNHNGFVLCAPMNDRVGKVSNFFQKNTSQVRLGTMLATHPESYIESLVWLNSGTFVNKPKGQN